MLIYSIMPANIVFPSNIPPKTIKQVKGGYLEMDGNNRIQRIISTDLKMYLKYNVGDFVDLK